MRSDSSFLMLPWKLQPKPTQTNPASPKPPKKPRIKEKISHLPSVHICLCPWIKQAKELWQGVTGSQLDALPLMGSRAQIPHTGGFFHVVTQYFSKMDPKKLQAVSLSFIKNIHCQGKFPFFLFPGFFFCTCFAIVLSLVSWSSHEGNTALSQCQKGKGKITSLFFSGLLFVFSTCCMLSQIVFLWGQSAV